MKREMPEWLEKELIQWAQSQEWFSKMTRVSFLSLQIGMRKTFELMSEQQKPRPIDENTPRDRKILVKELAWFEAEYIGDLDEFPGDECWDASTDAEEITVLNPTHWMELPTLEGE